MEVIFVTGGAGFIGSSLIDKLLESNNKIIAVDNFNDYYQIEIKDRNIREIKENMKNLGVQQANFKMYKEDIRDREAMERIFRENNIGMVIHLAAMAGVRPSIVKPELYYDVNINGTLNLLEVARRSKLKKFIFSSSSSVYGNNNKVPFKESDFVDHPISPYAASKKAGELLCYTYHHLYDMSVACLRFFTVYGPRQRPDLAINKFCSLIKEGNPIPIFGDGTTGRDYTHIDDIVDGIIKSIEWLKKDEKQYEVFNIGGSRIISLREMTRTIEEALGIKAKIDHQSIQPGDVKQTFADITKAKAILGYSPRKEFKEGIVDFINWLAVVNGR